MGILTFVQLVAMEKLQLCRATMAFLAQHLAKKKLLLIGIKIGECSGLEINTYMLPTLLGYVNNVVVEFIRYEVK